MISIGKERLTIENLVKVARFNEKVQMDDYARAKIIQSHERLEKIVSNAKPVYGINTGFGIFSDRSIKPDEISKLSRNLIISHAVGTGNPLSREITRAAMLVRANTLAQGYSGVRIQIVNTLIEMLNKGVTPVIPSQGSLGSSGDLCQLSHMALVFTKDDNDLDNESGQAEFNGMILSGKEAMAKAGIQRIQLGAKEGLAINNGATFSAALGALSIWECEYLTELADRSMALSCEALLGCSAAFDERLHEARGQCGQIESAKMIRKMIQGSTLINSTKRVQDAYSLRCAPQIHGAVRDTVAHAKRVIEIEINAATDNPLLFEPDEALSGGNFHGEPVGMVLDFLTIALCELGAISERRVFRLTDEKLNQGLPPMLVDSFQAAGLNSGVMMPQYTAASLVLENQTLATPDSVHSLPTSAEQEDHNANAMTAARHCWQVVLNSQHIISIELYVAARALDIRLRENQNYMTGNGTKDLHQLIRNNIPYQAGDLLWGAEIESVKEMIQQHLL